ncbi:hypothetical protein K438DRAFT_1759744 [Mycena galopus ATCC 62051]|nr:hypothetical protein K438DRAFT_1759744 [Mycena galopus ATCC 62051]
MSHLSSKTLSTNANDYQSISAEGPSHVLEILSSIFAEIWTTLKMLPACTRALHRTRIWAGTRLSSSNSNQLAKQTPGEKVRTRIVVENVPRVHDNDGAEMNTRGWLGEDDQANARRMLTTLSPRYLTAADYTILSNRPHPAIAFIPRTQSFPIRFFKTDTAYQPFPPGTRGFLYYYVPRHLPPMAGGLRFRITPRGHPASFEDGHDLLHEGLPWEISLVNIASAVGRKTVLRDQLLKEGLVTQADLDHCCAITPNKKRLDPKITLYRLAQPFPVAFHRGLYAWVVGEAEIKPWSYAFMFADNRAQYRPLVRPYTGSALAQFELSTLPEHAGRPVVVMRIVKMLTPPTCVVPGYDNAIPTPVEGELFLRPMGHARATRLQPWYCDLAAESSDSAAALRTLVEERLLAL